MRGYFDYASGCPVDERVLEAMLPYFSNPGNPSSVHSLGYEAREAVERARKSVAELINSSPEEIIFTSGATEANNLAIIGFAMRNRDKGKHIITSSIEHMSVINPCKFLQKNGFDVTYLPVDREGLISLEALEREIRDDTILISIQHANGEIGTIQPIEEIREISKDIPLHVDAVASLGKIEVDVQKLGADLLTISSNDIYGPRGMGALFIRREIRVNPMILGGGQERGLRSGTENVASIVGFGTAAEIARREFREESERLRKYRDEIIERVLEIEESYLNGSRERRLPNNVNVRFSYIEGESLVLSLDMEGFQTSTGSACSSKTLQPSHVLRAIGLKHEEAHGSLLITTGRFTEKEDVERLLEALSRAVERLRMMSPLYRRR